MARSVFVYEGDDVVTSTSKDYEIAFLKQTLGASALATDSINDLRYKFYKGVVEGSISLGGGGAVNSLDLGTSNGAGGYYYSIPGTGVSGRQDTDVLAENNRHTLFALTVPRPIRIRRLAQDYNAITGTPTGAGTRHAIYERLDYSTIGNLVTDLNSADPFAVAAAFTTKTVDITVPDGQYFVVSHHDYAGVSAISQRKYPVPGAVTMQSEQAGPSFQGAIGAWPGSWPASGSALMSAVGTATFNSTPYPSGLPNQNLACVLFGWDNA